MFLIPLLALFAAIVLILMIVQLRQIAALPFARAHGRWMPAVPPGPVADLYAAADTELLRLGFSPARWMHMSSADAAMAPLRAVYVHQASATALWLLPPGATAPNRLNAYFVTRLAGARMLITQPFDAYFEMLAAERDLVGASSGETLTQNWAAHKALLGTHGAGDPEAVTADGLLAFNNDWMEQRRQDLIARGQLVPRSDDLALPTLAFAWRIFRAIRRTPKLAPDNRVVPAARIAMVASQLEKIRARSPSKPVEISLFAISVILFMALGALFWDPMTAWMILVVIIIHELGHFLAMRAFGYRNVHMMALPLVGGVAIGQDVDPSAYRSAWMSLMGPLPGILIGWGILIAVWTGQWPLDVGNPVAWATIFLLINYLNVLPVPPLDGGHVMQALLPPRRAWIEVGFLALACTLGAWLAWQFDLVILTVLALLQLLSLPGRLKAQRALATLATEGLSRDKAHGMRLRRVSEALERVIGPTHEGVSRVGLVLDVLQRLDRKPMRWWQSLAILGVFAVLLVVPVGVILTGYSLSAGDAVNSAALKARSAQIELETQQALQQVKDKSDAELLLAWGETRRSSKAASGVTDADLRLAEESLGMALPAELVEWYRIKNGEPALMWVPIRQLVRVDDRLDQQFADWQADSLRVISQMEGRGTATVEIPAAQLQRWLLVSDGEFPLLVNPAPDGMPVRIIQWWSDPAACTGYASLRDWLESSWVQAQQDQRQAERIRMQQEKARQALAGADWPEILNALEIKVAFPYSLLGDAVAVPEPATDEDLRDAARRLGTQKLPADFIDLLRLQNGVERLGIGAADEFVLLDAARLAENPWLQDVRSPRMTGLLANERPVELQSTAELTGCWRLSNNASGQSDAIVYCPTTHAHAGILDLRSMSRYDTLRDYGIRAAARMSLLNAVDD